MGPDILVPFMLFSFLGAIIITPILAKERTRRSAHDLISQAMARGQALDPVLVQQLTQNMLDEGNRARKSLGSGVILLALAGGITAAGLVSGFADEPALMTPAIIIGAVGAAFLILAIFDYATKQKRET